MRTLCGTHQVNTDGFTREQLPVELAYCCVLAYRLLIELKKLLNFVPQLLKFSTTEHKFELVLGAIGLALGWKHLLAAA